MTFQLVDMSVCNITPATFHENRWLYNDDLQTCKLLANDVRVTHTIFIICSQWNPKKIFSHITNFDNENIEKTITN